MCGREVPWSWTAEDLTERKFKFLLNTFKRKVKEKEKEKRERRDQGVERACQKRLKSTDKQLFAGLSGNLVRRDTPLQPVQSLPPPPPLPPLPPPPPPPPPLPLRSFPSSSPSSPSLESTPSTSPKRTIFNSTSLEGSFSSVALSTQKVQREQMQHRLPTAPAPSSCLPPAVSKLCSPHGAAALDLQAANASTGINSVFSFSEDALPWYLHYHNTLAVTSLQLSLPIDAGITC